MAGPVWISVGSRGELEELRRRRTGDVFVIQGGLTQIYGRPGDRLCVALDESRLAGHPRRIVAALPVRAGVLVPASAAGLAVLAEAKARGRSPLAARVSSAADIDAAAAAGAEFVVAADRSLMHYERAGITVIGEVMAFSAAGAPAGSTSAAPRPNPAAVGTFGATLDHAVRAAGGREAVVDLATGRRQTFTQLKDEAHQIGRALLASGVGRGARVAVLAGNVAEWPAIQLAAGTIGAILVPINPGYRPEEVAYQLGQSGSTILLAAPGERHVADLETLLAAPGAPKTAVAIGEGVSSPHLTGWSAWLKAGSAMPGDRVTRASASVHADDVACILYTSGTAGGAVKGAMLTHRGMLQNAIAVGAALRLSSEDRLCLPVPLHHCFGCVMGTLAALVYQATLVIPSLRFDATKTLQAIAAERCTVLYGVPTMFHALLEARPNVEADLTSLRTGIIAGAPVDPALARQAARELHMPQFTIAYGLTEASPVVTQTAVDDPEDMRLGTVGRPIAGATVKVIDPNTGRTLPVGKIGELCTRGPMVMRGYHGMSEETRKAIDPGGWLHTGDLAERDAHGYWRIEGRVKDMIIRGGENISPAELETIARRHPAIADAAVVGIPSEYYGEEVFVWIRPVAGASIAAGEVQRHLAEHVAAFKVPKAVGFLEQFPMTESGKVLKTKLREMAASGERSPAVATPSAPEATPASVGLPLLGTKSDFGSAITPGAAPSTTPSPAPGWRRPDQPTWGAPGAQPTNIEKEKPMPATTTGNGRKRGKRIKPWGIGTNVREQIEATGEKPIMYEALGTPVRTEHPFNLYNDIRSQPDALSGTFETAGEAVEVARRIQEHRSHSVIGLGSGTSQYVAQVANAAFARFAGLPGWDFDSLAFLRYPPPLDFSKIVAMAYSGSGSTVDTVAAARRSREQGAFTVAFTSVDGSPVVQNTDARILTAGGFDTGGSDTFHYTARVAASIYLALELGKLRGKGDHDYADLQRQLLDTPRMMAERFDSIDSRCKTIAERHHDVRGILVVGAGSNYGTAEEIALKFDEMSHIPTKPMLPGRHIHGALGLTDEQILTVLVAPPGPAYEDMVTIAKVTSMLKTPSVAIVSDDDDKIGDLVDYVIRLPLKDETLFAVLAVLPGQLLPYWCGVLLGHNPDTQRSNIPKYARVWNMLFPANTH
ncbi:MAG: AMP-binding protein [Candidatus Dormibacterales bacterium]